VIALAPDSRRFYCRNVLAFQATANLGRAGRLEERNLETGAPTGVVLDPQQGTVGDIGVTADGRELVTFSYNAPVIARWRLDGTGPVTSRVAQGRVGAAFDPTGRLLLVSHDPEAPLFQDERRSPDDWYVWDPTADRMVDPLDGIVNAAWGPPGELAAVFTGHAGGFYDLDTRSRIHGPPLKIDGPIANTFRSLDGRRLHVGFVDGRIRTLDATTRGWIEPTIQLAGQIGSLSATGDGSRIVATSLHQGRWQMTVHDGTTGAQIGEAVPNVNTAQVAPDGTLVAANYQGQITQYDPDTLQPTGSFPGVRGFIAPGGLRFSSDSKVLLATDGRNVSAYDVASHLQIGDSIAIDVFGPRGTSLRPDGMAIAIGDGNGIAIWDIRPDHLQAAACRLAGRNLTRPEWSTHLAQLGEYRLTCPQYA
jgi:WD40 repeat protein